MNGHAARGGGRTEAEVRDIMGKPGLHYDIIEEGPCSTVARAWTAIEDGKPQWVVVKSASTVRKFAREPHDIVKELRLLSSLAHPNIVNLMGSFVDEHELTLSIYMPYLPISLAEILASPLFSPHPLPSLSVPDEDTLKLPDERFKIISKSIMLQTLCALAFLHDDKRRIAHRDIKPENIMLTKEGCVKLIDFGTAWKEKESEEARSGDLWSECPGRLYFEVSTRAYRAPELLFSSRSYDPIALDLWSLGATFAEFFTPLRLSSEEEDECDDDDQTEDNEEPDDDQPRPLEPFIVPKYLRIGYPGAQWTRDTLFNGERGEIGLAWSIFKILGTPTDETWPEFENLPGSKSVVFNIVPPVPLAPLLPNLPPSSLALDLLQRFLVYPASQRLRARDALRHDWFTSTVAFTTSKPLKDPESFVLLPKGYSLAMALETATSGSKNIIRDEWKGKTLAEYLDSVLVAIPRSSDT
ncbi:hypothetical protein NLJ89_g5848 [Agrocybe chaxingu]|uniref:cyclin-dependent kinase n=1 Tax=Agrocybe chaxingu TaxID=84603 RepID=A0A9W8K0G8_9AGAR|nr:hypothetical protein NLJ89_g5848 [Agrocybe chaxingu]